MNDTPERSLRALACLAALWFCACEEQGTACEEATADLTFDDDDCTRSEVYTWTAARCDLDVDPQCIEECASCSATQTRACFFACLDAANGGLE